jgi:type IV secretion system protein VirB9
MAGNARSGDDRARRESDLSVWRDPALGHLLATAGLRYRVARRRDRPTSGATGGQAIHLIVKPSEAGLVTSMVVTTSRRTYHIQLKSHPSQYMARIGFEYPEDVSMKLADINARLETGGIPGTAHDKLNFSYSISGSASWRPKRVYSDGAKTYIQFPRSISGQDAPVLFVVSGGQNRIVNYRMKNDMMIVDYAVDKAVLVSGVGWRQQKITIRRGG